MDRAEQRALEKYPYAEMCREKYLECYHQAEEDLELTWEDVKYICEELYGNIGNCGDYYGSQAYYEEVLRRFMNEKAGTERVGRRIKEVRHD